jgi:hypothetical protein
VRLDVKTNGRHYLLIEVEDSGPGINPDNQQRLFLPFVQLVRGGGTVRYRSGAYYRPPVGPVDGRRDQRRQSAWSGGAVPD